MIGSWVTKPSWFAPHTPDEFVRSGLSAAPFPKAADLHISVDTVPQSFSGFDHDHGDGKVMEYKVNIDNSEGVRAMACLSNHS